MSFLKSVFAPDEEYDKKDSSVDDEIEDDEEWEDMHEKVAKEKRKMKQIKRIKANGEY
jgi:hypothetical protein